MPAAAHDKKIHKELDDYLSGAHALGVDDRGDWKAYDKDPTLMKQGREEMAVVHKRWDNDHI